MIEIECPKCHTVFEEDESKFADIVRQVRDAEFNRELSAQTKALERERESAVAEAAARAREASQGEVAKRDQQIAQLKAQIEAAKSQQELALEGARAQSREEVASLKAQLEAQEAAARLREEKQRGEADRTLAERDRQIGELRQQIKAQGEAFEDRKALAVSQATAAVERERDDFRHRAELAQSETKRLSQQLEDERASSLRRQEEIIRQKDKELEDYKSMQSRLTVKMVGESLEQHCETEFNKWRSAFPLATFGKDNEVVAGSKGDFVFRDYDEAGTEYLSVMFEMKNEEGESTNRHKNADFLDKLDRDRRNKNCEYAVLVTTLEKDNEFYNQGIVDVSGMCSHPKTYVIRPQFFIPLLTFLQSVAQGTLDYRRQIERLKGESIDIEYFNQALGDFKAGFGRDYEHASKKLSDAIDGIDRAISQLERIRESFRLTETHLSRANRKAEDLTIKRLTKNSPLLAERFSQLEEAPAQGEGIEPDQVETPSADRQGS
ncbi:DUF2130 domain-containing protein [Olsenella porci]|uniref:DUF2130 domain-containing protein n=1 Tax=Olsenella porci TaxID=2652279 RepID=A0A6N7XRS4_9ACTN|nr:DUF2130 domain-containing protein [Olsenella porci]MST72716.1 DUF2130 domain-containing protein [Olsenella porci]